MKLLYAIGIFMLFAMFVPVIIGAGNPFNLNRANRQVSSDNCNCYQPKCGRGHYSFKGKKPLCLPPAPPVFGKLFTNITNHIAVVVDSTVTKPGQNSQLDVQKEYFNRLTLGPWKAPAVFRNYSTYYCGEEVPFNINIHLTASRDYDNGTAFHEIFELVDHSKNFFRDWYDQMGPSIVYHGLIMNTDSNGNPVMTTPEFVQYMEDQNLELIFHLPSCPKDAYFFRSGYALVEVVLPC
ncbi:hypothetical protein QLL95_gp0622 [Cotonvirus japonicus]|uniref:Uncharacterized protein n=1 Tax=Cotonvirus japonicus TaxID=2811091 RepID=A0ABM7NTS3_9VIRU|nr:hypothetical protein QLL95_gp0622 [Cotonvirus japonicus]BCS83501.1 hypothetical protein [Cotonvirus japonicus]